MAAFSFGNALTFAFLDIIRDRDAHEFSGASIAFERSM